MKLLHTSDWHLGMTVRGGLSYAEDQKYIIDQICQIATRESVDGILIAGDIFDKNVASQEAIRLYDEVVTNICENLDIPVFIVAGNHDGADRLAQYNKLLRKSGLYIVGSLEKEPHKVSLGDTNIFLLPWISTDKVKTVYEDAADTILSIEDAYRVVLDDYRAHFDKDKKNVLVSHAYVSSATTSESDIAAIVGTAAMVDASVFDGFDYVALGHIHGPQQITDRIRYSGSPIAYSFGVEEKQKKSVTIYDSEKDEQHIVELSPLHERHTITDTLENILKADYDEKVLDGFVRLEITDSYVGFDTASLFKDRYKNVIEYKCPDISSESESISMTMDELEEVKKDPSVIFGSYCKDVLGIDPSESIIKMFEDAIADFGKEVDE